MKKLEVFGKLFFDNKTYFILLINRCRIAFACFENEKIRFNLNIKEFNMMKKIYNTLLINENKL